MENKAFLLVACGRRKSETSCYAKDMYNSNRFQGLKRIAEENHLWWGIFSAKHGLLFPKDVIEPYDVNLSCCTTEQRQSLRELFEKQVSSFPKTTIFVVVADAIYSSFIAPIIQSNGFVISTPFLSKDEMMVEEYVNNAARIQHVFRFYSELKRLMEKTGGARRISDCSGKQYWPERGVYFILDNTEHTIFVNNFPRVVRIGTHAVSAGSKSTLWKRLKTHKGTNDGSGNHRGSIFRLHVGNSLKNRDNLSFPTWGHGQNASKEVRQAEDALERKVSEYIGQLSVVVLDINDLPSSTSLRSYVEKNSIALVSSLNSSFNFSTSAWLGNYSPRQEIRESALWNINYIDSIYDPNFIDTFSQLVDETIDNYNLNQTN